MIYAACAAVVLLAQSSASAEDTRPASVGTWAPPLLSSKVEVERQRKPLRPRIAKPRETNQTLRAAVLTATMLLLPRAHSSNSCGDETGTVGRGPHDGRSNSMWACSSVWRPN